MGVRRGKDFKLYRNTDDPYDNSPTWVEVKNVRDLTRNGDPDMADASIRGSTIKLSVPTMLGVSLDFQMVYDPDDLDVIAFEAAAFSDGLTLVEVLDLDGPITTVGTKGLRMMAAVSKFTLNEAMADVGLYDVSLVPGYAPLNLPRRVHVASPGSVVDS